MADIIMGEDAVEPQENKENEENEADAGSGDDNINEEEFEAINAQLDQLNSALDSLERKNDDIHAELVELLKSNREAREQFQESQKEQLQSFEKPNP
ncbi:bublin coiled-coil protein [Neodiprion pinetum]|uniref:UPF0184 protein C9orf16 n=1 Tax=Neodiprion lecontei TaxID=441921 RepID=A0A6J0BGH9_NEOLC|nr:bublin coiled-coil protein [Neodiprion lecontei]XP_015513551.1 bublin coiled-coil protein [Neodiprion lecontei]XP_046413975.1 bublin coiled-coil protein [Neodiprion fabricii]XP_046413976.1 bublin coiled-coil protein [Neodiprion fabricii]XP_046467112.1 bublin coiled-coil protein [Neodiprion pinetum]XP_046467113.1 bublin coiled-coil protein [Neodiprion pinetum]XP_046607373.1 bublin coiled-coil protein [Neodiprion virginianus]XP_046607374.1 bublin coiled-coil protein [Neodiprion virginianus]